MVRLVTSVLAVSLVVLPALAVSSKQYQRSVAESDLYGRDLASLDDIILTREDLDEIFGREFINDFEARSPLSLGMVVNGAKAAMKLGKKAGRHSHHSDSFGSSNNNDNNNRREFDEEEFDLRDFDEDLEAREPINVERVLHHAHQAYTMSQYIPQSNNNYGRDVDELVFERDFEDEEFFAREYYDDLD